MSNRDSKQNWLLKLADLRKLIALDREPVESSNLRSVGYDPETETLEVEFESDAVYTYDNVPEEEFENLMEAESHGSYFYWNIRMDFPYERIASNQRGLTAPGIDEMEKVLRNCLKPKDWEVEFTKVENLKLGFIRYTFETNRMWDRKNSRGFYISKSTYKCINSNLTNLAEQNDWDLVPHLKRLEQEKKSLENLPRSKSGKTTLIFTIRFRKADSEQLELECEEN